MHGQLPGCAYAEEALEASLSRLAQSAGTDLRAKSVKEFADMYAAMGPPSSKEHHLKKSRVPFVFIQQVRLRVTRTMTAIDQHVLPFIEPSSKLKYSEISLSWPLRYY